MDRQGELGIIRAAYAKQILAAAGVVDNARLEAALSATRREDFLGAGPWFILRRFRDYVTPPDADPVYLYTDDLVGILPERQINNGAPSLHAHLIHLASPATGKHVVHIGTGTGYYTALGPFTAQPRQEPLTGSATPFTGSGRGRISNTLEAIAFAFTGAIGVEIGSIGKALKQGHIQ